MFNSSELDLFFAHISASIAMHLTGMPFFAAILRGCQSCNTFIYSIHKKVCKFITGVKENSLGLFSHANSFLGGPMDLITH
jgi:hypothetical protein